MIRTLGYQAVTEDGKAYAELFGLSTDTKPVDGLVTGSRFTEVDTGDVYLLDETGGGTWAKVHAGYVAQADSDD